MENRLSKLSRKAYFMLLLLAVSGISTSCKDEYILDDEKPSWISSSIYDKLEQKGNYSYYLRLLGDPDVQPQNARSLTEVLSRTGSKTVFVADDEAWEDFFKRNAQRAASDPWHTATSYENLSLNQKKLLIHTSMLNNAIVLENLSSSSSDISSRGDFMRRYTDVETTDSITFVDGNSLPVNYNVGNDEKDFWWRFRKQNGGKGIYMVCDSSLSMMIHFTNEYLTKNNVTDQDFAKFMGSPRITSDVHIYDAKLLDKDEVAENGYLNRTEKVLAPLPNMAEAIRTNGETYIFSHMLDRWSAPFYNDEVTKSYTDVMKARGITWTDSIFTKRYFSDDSYGHKALSVGPDKQVFRDKQSPDVNLKFDPGWNGLVTSDDYWSRNATTAPQYNMAAMFVPTDSVMWKYFTEGGGGWQLLKTYYLKEGTIDEIPYVSPGTDYKDSLTRENLYRQIDQIPISTLRSLINVIMHPSFTDAVPSKMTTLRDDAMEQIFLPEDVDNIKSTVLANNGMVYLMKKVYGPADYTSVAAPAYISNTNLVMRWAIYNGSTKATDYMGLNYYAYLKAMQSKFVLFLPSDAGMRYYYDPVSFTNPKSRVLHFYYSSGDLPIKFNMYAYNNQTGEFGQLYNLEKMSNTEITNRLKDILESHTLVLDGINEINSGIDEYYLAKNGAAVKVTRQPDANGVNRVVKVQGGFQLENEERDIDGFVGDKNKAYTEIHGINANLVTDEQDMANGTTYILDSPMIPASRSVWNIMTDNGRYGTTYDTFYSLCSENSAIIKACGLVDETNLTLTEQNTEMKKYTVFAQDGSPDFNVQFFNNYRYTVFVPTDDAIQTEIARGLPTWEDIEADYYSLPHPQVDSIYADGPNKGQVAINENGDTIKVDDPDRYILTSADSLRLQAKITYLINFVRYHFVDNSVFVDKSQLANADYVTASYDNVKGLFCKLNIQRPSAGTLQVKDDNGGNWVTVGGKYNVMARDVTCSTSPSDPKLNSMNGITIDGSSFAVIHQIPEALNHTELVGGRHDSNWATPGAATRYLKRFAIHKNR